MSHLLSALRPKHWVKNLFLFLPLVFGEKIFVYPENRDAVLAFVFFCAASSAVYLVNDVWDVEGDRKHPVKRSRPVASGTLSATVALGAAFILGVLSLALSFVLDRQLGWITAAYLSLNLIYSRFLKHRVIVDVFCLAAFFLLRVAAGSAAAEIELSHRILFMTALLALFMGFGKRRQELELVKTREAPRKVLQEYDEYFIDQMMGVITASIVIAYMLYTVDAQTIDHVGSDHLIYSIPFVYYGIFRYLYLIHKIKIDGDPTAVLLSDRRMQLNVVLWMASCVAVIYFGW